VDLPLKLRINISTLLDFEKPLVFLNGKNRSAAYGDERIHELIARRWESINKTAADVNNKDEIR
jgi:hypothetical protein